MKKIFSLLLIGLNLIFVSGCRCSKVDFNYFSDNVNSIENYKYYFLTQEIYSNDLLLYKQDKNVYFDGNKSRIVIDTQSINAVDEEEIYSQNKEEFYKQENNLYYKENGKWKMKTQESSEKIGLSLSKDMFSNYKIDKGDKRTFQGIVKNDCINEFFGFKLENVSDVKLNIVINKNDKVESVSLEYNESNGNRIVVYINIGYELISTFEIPTVG